MQTTIENDVEDLCAARGIWLAVRIGAVAWFVAVILTVSLL